MQRIAEAVDRHRRGDLPGAEALYRDVLADDPDHVDAHQLLGALLHRAGRPTEALHHLDRALALAPDHAPALANRAAVLLALDRRDEAEASAARAVALRGDLAEARLLLARLRLARGDAPSGADAAEPIRDRLDPGLVAAIGERLVPTAPRRGAEWLAVALRDGAPCWVPWVDAVMQCAEPPIDQGDLLLRALSRDDLDHQRLDRAVRATLDATDDPLASPLLVPFLRRAIVQSPTWERRLSALREQPLPLALAEALALQAWYTGYAWPDRDPGPPPSPDDPDAVARWAMYRDPAELGDGRWTTALPHLAAATLHAARAEAAEAAAIEGLALTDDAVSVAVRAQYEEDPYPRLFSVHRRTPVPLATALRGQGIDVTLPDRLLDVLIAGCGTGQHPLQAVSAWSDVRILAIDLSRRSLARARRRARALDLLDRLAFAQADILALDGLDRTFDVVDSVGVLHHLDDPLEGWRILRDRLRPGGLMRIGLYSERGRGEVVAARAVVEARGLGTSPADLREARQQLMALPAGHPAARIVHSPDFYSLSGLRDLVFHACEHRFTLPAIEAALDRLGLRFLGFQHPRARGSRDLRAWQAAEAADPTLFGGLYVFWCQGP